MRFITLDTIVRSALLDCGYSMHWYLQFLHYGQNVLRELSFDDIHAIRSVLMNVNTYGAVDLPDDYVDKIRIGVRYGQFVRPLLEDGTMNRLKDYDSTGNVIRYSDDANIYPNGINNINYGFSTPLFWRLNTTNEYGENIGRLFGFGQGTELDTYSIIRERNQIQFNENMGYTQIVLDYISDGMSSDACAAVDVYAIQTIKTYIKWQRKEHSRSYSMGEREMEKQQYYTERKKLRSRKNPLTIEQLKRIMNRNYMAAPK